MAALPDHIKVYRTNDLAVCGANEVRKTHNFNKEASLILGKDATVSEWKTFTDNTGTLVNYCLVNGQPVWNVGDRWLDTPPKPDLSDWNNVLSLTEQDTTVDDSAAVPVYRSGDVDLFSAGRTCLVSYDNDQKPVLVINKQAQLSPWQVFNDKQGRTVNSCLLDGNPLYLVDGQWMNFLDFAQVKEEIAPIQANVEDLLNAGVIEEVDAFDLGMCSLKENESLVPTPFRIFKAKPGVFPENNPIITAYDEKKIPSAILNVIDTDDCLFQAFVDQHHHPVVCCMVQGKPEYCVDGTWRDSLRIAQTKSSPTLNKDISGVPFSPFNVESLLNNNRIVLVSSPKHTKNEQNLISVFDPSSGTWTMRLEEEKVDHAEYYVWQGENHCSFTTYTSRMDCRGKPIPVVIASAPPKADADINVEHTENGWHITPNQVFSTTIDNKESSGNGKEKVRPQILFQTRDENGNLIQKEQTMLPRPGGGWHWGEGTATKKELLKEDDSFYWGTVNTGAAILIGGIMLFSDLPGTLNGLLNSELYTAGNEDFTDEYDELTNLLNKNNYLKDPSSLTINNPPPLDVPPGDVNGLSGEATVCGTSNCSLPPKTLEERLLLDREIWIASGDGLNRSGAPRNIQNFSVNEIGMKIDKYIDLIDELRPVGTTANIDAINEVKGAGLQLRQALIDLRNQKEVVNQALSEFNMPLKKNPSSLETLNRVLGESADSTINNLDELSRLLQRDAAKYATYDANSDGKPDWFNALEEAVNGVTQALGNWETSLNNLKTSDVLTNIATSDINHDGENDALTLFKAMVSAVTLGSGYNVLVDVSQSPDLQKQLGDLVLNTAQKVARAAT